MCPTRRRWELLFGSLASLRDLADAPSQVEYLVAHDSDDVPPDLDWSPSVKFWQAPERYGYAGLHYYYNQLALLARGDWLFLWNDDAVMHTRGWDTVVVNHKPAHLFTRHDGPMHCNAFPIWPAEWTHILGHVSLGCFCDSWLQWIAEQLGTQQQVDIYLTHQTPNDLTFIEGRGRNPVQYGLEPLLAEDVQRLGAHLGLR